MIPGLYSSQELVGIIPAAGQGSRLAPLPCSKELFPIGFQYVDGSSRSHPKAVSHYLFEKMRNAGVKNSVIILREGKWDIPSYFNDGKMVDMHLAYFVTRRQEGVPFTINEAYPFIMEKTVVFGFPDILFSPSYAFDHLLSRLKISRADLVLGLFPADNPQKVDMVELGEEGKITDIIIKPKKTSLTYTWLIAVWSPGFTKFLHDYALQVDQNLREELFLGDVIRAGINKALSVESVVFGNGRYLDIGTPEDLVKAIATKVVY